MKKHVYFIPGMWASSKIFERIHFPKNLYEIHYLEWLTPLSKKEPLENYILRLSKLVTEDNPIFIGVSFGGIVAQELAHKFNNAPVVIISSIKHQNELSPFYQFVKKTKLYQLFPIRFFNFTENVFYKFSGNKTKRTLLSYRKYLPFRNVMYTKWAIHHFLHWKQNNTLNTVHIHGTKDKILSSKYLKTHIHIHQGTHAMILTKSSTIQSQILKHLG